LEKKLNQAIQWRALPRPLPGNFVRAGRSDGGGILNYMVKPKLDKFREARIAMEIVVDCYNEVECFFGGWFCYLEEKLEFPFRARCVTRREVSPLKMGEEVDVIGMLDEGWDNSSEILVRIKWARTQAWRAAGSIGRHRSQQPGGRSHCRLALLVCVRLLLLADRGFC
jgi:hypothetical protein